VSLIAWAALAGCRTTASVQKVDVAISADPTCSDALDSAAPEDSGPAHDCDVPCSDCTDNVLAWGGVCIEDEIQDDGDVITYTTSLKRGEISDLIWLQYTGDADHGDYVETEPYDIVLVRTYSQDRPLGVRAAYMGNVDLYELDEDGEPRLRDNEGVSASVEGDELTFAYLDGAVPIEERHHVGPFQERPLRVHEGMCCNGGAGSPDATGAVFAAFLTAALRRRYAPNKASRTIDCVRPGPTPISAARTPTRSSSVST
jgi:hypothetical protein